MKYNVTHKTTYLYSARVSVCHTLVHLSPCNGPHQTVYDYSLKITPEPASSTTRQDYFGNEITCFSIHHPHETLNITARSTVEVRAEEPPHAGFTPAWEDVAQGWKFETADYILRSPKTLISPEFAEFAAVSFTPRRPILEAALELSHRIYTDFTFDPRATTISTPVAEVLQSRRGVCQDYAHVMISCLRSLGLPARYVSGYLRSGGKSRGTEVSHAWCALYCGDFGWLEFDPTNDLMPRGGHVTIGYGRDYTDVAPVVGVTTGGGEQFVNVGVSVEAVGA